MIPPLALAGALFLLSLPAQAVTIIHTNDVLGEIEPCGCRNNPQGGMSRKLNYVNKLADKELIQLDSGDLLFATLDIPEMLREQSELQATYLLKAMDLSGHDAIVPGEKDFSMGFKVFEKLRSRTKAQFLAANLKKRSGGDYLAPSKIFTRKSIRVAVIGVVGEELSWPKELRATPALPAAKAELARLKGKADYFVALTHQGFDKDVELAKKVPGFDLIIGAHTQSFLQQPEEIGKTLILQSSFRNQYVGAMPLVRPLKPAQYQLIGLDPGYESPAGKPTAMDQLVAEFKKAVSELNTRQQGELEKQARKSPAKPGEIQYQTFPRCAECHMKQFDFWRKSQHALAYHTLIEKQQAQNKECLSCHTVGLGETGGFRDITKLAETKLPNVSPSPIPLEPGELDLFIKRMHEAPTVNEPVQVSKKAPEIQPLRNALSSVHRAWTPVQCENCHQPGREHPFSGSYSKTVEKNACLKCHTADRAPEWYTGAGQPDWKKIDAKRSLVTCPPGELEAE